jgi:penicillin-binding protein 1A
MDPSTGDLLAVVGGSNYARSTFNRAMRSRRQPGSAFKPFVFSAALAHGYSPVSILKNLDRVTTPEDPEWRPRSVSHGDEAGHQPLTLRVALAESNNAAAAVLQQDVGTREVLRLASQAGLNDLPDVPSLALGTGLVTPIDLATAYTMFPGGGEIARPRGVLQVLDSNGYQVFDRPIERLRIVSEPVAFQMVSMLRDAVDRGTGAAARTLGVAGPVAGKTGTTDDYRDAWFVGFSTSVVAAVWVGLDQPASIGREAYGARIALPIWAEFMKRTARELPAREFPVPEGIRDAELCSVSHLKPVDGCPVYTEYFKDGDDVPSQLCPVHKGTFKQAATRAVTGFFRRLGGAIGGIFQRR